MLPKLDEDLKTALKAGDKQAVGTLRLLKNALANARIQKRDELSDAETVSVLQKQAKQRRESIEMYQAGGRTEAAAAETAELAIIATYLPAGLSDEELDSLIDAVIAETGATTASDIGKVMGVLSSQIAGRADGGEVAGKVRAKLQTS